MTHNVVTVDFGGRPPPSGAERLLDLARKGQVELPVAPSAANGVLALCEMAELPYDRMANLILQEPNLAARVLQLANSPFYGSARPVANVGHALMRVGERGLRSVLLSAASGKLMAVRAPEPIGRALQARAIGCAIATEALNRRAATRVDACFAAGVLHDLGRALGIGLAMKHRSVLPEAWLEQPSAMLEAVDEIHGELGGLVAAAWRFPPNLVSAIRFHHCPELAPPEHQPLVNSVRFGLNVLDHLNVFPEGAPTPNGAEPAPPLGLTAAVYLEVRSEVWQELERAGLVSDRRRARDPVKRERRRKKS